MIEFLREREMRPLVTAWIESHGLRPVWETSIGHLVDIVGVRFSPRLKREMPELERMIAVELKLFDISGVINQCRHNRCVVNASWAAMPKSVVSRMRSISLDKFSNQGIGLLAVDEGVEVVIPAVEQELPRCGKQQLMRRRFWRYLRSEIVAGETQKRMFGDVENGGAGN